MMTFKEFVDAVDQRARASWTKEQREDIHLDDAADDLVAWQRSRHAVWLRKRSEYTALIERVETLDREGRSGTAPDGGELHRPLPINEQGVKEAVKFLDWLRTVKSP
jgi:hypothetical protein